MNTPQTIRERILTARKTLVLDHVFFGALALRMSIVEETRGRTRTMATDGRAIYYDRDYVKSCSDVELLGLLAHEVMHPALQHHTRRADRDPNAWNDSADYAINLLLIDAGFTLPEGMLLDAQYRGMTAEQIYEARTQAFNDQEGGERVGGGDPTCDDPGDGEQGGDDGDATGQEGDRDALNSLADRAGAVWDASDPAAQQAEWQVALKQASTVAQMMGQLPAGIRQAVEESLKPQIGWRAVLRRFVQQCATADYSWRMPHRRYLSSGLFLPELRSESMPVLVVVVDSSGSTKSVLPRFKAELESIVEECQPEATIVIMADADVQRVDRFERGDPIEFNVEGLGGTDFRPAFAYIEREQLNPACLIYLTDGDGVYPEEAAEYPTLWAISTPDWPVPWGETLYIDAAAA
jgi:predicted metal-dependent peptidase